MKTRGTHAGEKCFIKSIANGREIDGKPLKKYNIYEVTLRGNYETRNIYMVETEFWDGSIGNVFYYEDYGEAVEMVGYFNS